MNEREQILDMGLATPHKTTGVVKEIGSVRDVETKYGLRTYIELKLSIPDTPELYPVNLFVNTGSPFLNPKSNAYALLKYLGVKKVSEVMGKKVPLVFTDEGYYKLNV